jgi:hypothetical protein
MAGSACTSSADARLHRAVGDAGGDLAHEALRRIGNAPVRSLRDAGTGVTASALCATRSSSMTQVDEERRLQQRRFSIGPSDCVPAMGFALLPPAARSFTASATSRALAYSNRQAFMRAPA